MPTSKNRQLAAILYADIVSYSSLMQKDEADALVVLNRFQSIIKDTAHKYEGEIIKTYGDGSLLLFLNTVNAVKFAQEIQLAFQERPKVPLRIGIHLSEYVRKGKDIFGNGVNIASRIESMGIANSVLLSGEVVNALANRPEFNTVNLGDFVFKNIEGTTTLFALANGELAIPKRSEMKGKGRIKIKPIESKKWLISTIVAGILIAVFAFWKSTTTTGTVKTTTITTENTIDNSLAVLPFANMSMNKENAYFSDGMHDDLLSHLSKVGNMKVISRTSVARFKNTQKSIPEIAELLGVDNIVEGSVRRAGEKIRINVQLIKAKTEENIWSESYDRALTVDNIFDIQAEIAKKIAIALQTTISTEQQIALETKPTENLAAYESYLKGRQLLEERTGQSIQAAKVYFENAVELDPNFAQAYIKLGEIAYLLVEYASADSKTNYAQAWDYLEKAKTINPNLAEIYGLSCTLYHYDKGDIAGAENAYQIAIAINPNYADVYFWYSHAVIEIEKDFVKALAILENAIRLNPLSIKFINRLAQTQLANQQKTAAIESYQKGIELAPNHIFMPRNLTFLYAYTGELDSAAIIALETINRNTNEPKFLRTYLMTLAQLDMPTELTAELNQFSLKSRRDSLYFFRFKEGYALQQGKFEEAKKYLQVLTGMDKDAQNHDPTLASNIYYYQKDFQKVIDIFEQNHPDLFINDYFQETMFSGYNRLLSLQEKLQKYIYSLSQIGQIEKADQLLAKYGDEIVANINPEGDQIWETKKRALFKVRNAIMKDEPDVAMKELNNYFDGEIMFDWQYLLIDPIFDDYKNDERYAQVVNNLQTIAAEQRAHFREYLLEKG